MLFKPRFALLIVWLFGVHRVGNPAHVFCSSD